MRKTASRYRSTAQRSPALWLPSSLVRCPLHSSHQRAKKPQPKTLLARSPQHDEATTRPNRSRWQPRAAPTRLDGDSNRSRRWTHVGGFEACGHPLRIPSGRRRLGTGDQDQRRWPGFPLEPGARRGSPGECACGLGGLPRRRRGHLRGHPARGRRMGQECQGQQRCGQRVHRAGDYRGLGGHGPRVMGRAGSLRGEASMDGSK